MSRKELRSLSWSVCRVCFVYLALLSLFCVVLSVSACLSVRTAPHLRRRSLSTKRPPGAWYVFAAPCGYCGRLNAPDPGGEWPASCPGPGRCVLGPPAGRLLQILAQVSHRKRDSLDMLAPPAFLSTLTIFFNNDYLKIRIADRKWGLAFGPHDGTIF